MRPRPHEAPWGPLGSPFRASPACSLIPSGRRPGKAEGSTQGAVPRMGDQGWTVQWTAVAAKMGQVGPSRALAEIITDSHWPNFVQYCCRNRQLKSSESHCCHPERATVCLRSWQEGVVRCWELSKGEPGKPRAQKISKLITQWNTPDSCLTTCSHMYT